MLMSISSVSGGGKTLSAILVASGLAGKDGRVGFLDTENGRGSMYADSPLVVSALPSGYDIVQLDPPFSPERYIEAVTAAEKAGINVLVVDSVTHEWEGIGGCCEIAERFKRGKTLNWARAKTEHKHFVNHCLSSPMHIIFCIRAREKVKFIKNAGGRRVETDDENEATSVIPLGIQPITEKNFVYEMLVSLRLDEESHHAIPVKVPQPLAQLFTGERLLTKADGERIREWNDGGKSLGGNEQLLKRARASAENGMAAYLTFHDGLSKADSNAIRKLQEHADNKAIAERADLEDIATLRGTIGDEQYFAVVGSSGYERIEDAPEEARRKIRAELAGMIERQSVA